LLQLFHRIGLNNYLEEKMKKSLFQLLTFVLVLTLLLGSFGSVKAAAGDDPTVTPVSGDMEFTTEIIPIASLPGTYELANHMLVPVGFPDGEAQFEGPGIAVLGMDHGKATVCFSLYTLAVQQGWGGKVGLWNGSKWVKLETSITTGTDEAAATLACAPIAGNGTYAFIKYVVAPDLLPKGPVYCSESTLQAVLVTARFRFLGRWIPGYMFPGTIISDKVYVVGSPVTFELLESDPVDIFDMPIKLTGTITRVYGPTTYEGFAGFYFYTLSYSTSRFEYEGSVYPSLAYRVSLPDCVFDGVYPPEFAGPN